MPHPKHDHVRARWGPVAVTAASPKQDVGGGLTVDHYVPLVAGGDDSDENLVYACFRCNLYKGDFHRTREDRANGHMVLHPLRDDILRHCTGRSDRPSPAAHGNRAVPYCDFAPESCSSCRLPVAAPVL